VANALRRPVVSEKSMNAAQRRNTYLFEVEPTANKIEIRREVEERFKVKVVSVRTMNRKGKVKARRRPTGRVPQAPDRKLAWVALAEGQTIDLA
jgi:large subunit ribosomal protein L23